MATQDDQIMEYQCHTLSTAVMETLEGVKRVILKVTLSLGPSLIL